MADNIESYNPPPRRPRNKKIALGVLFAALLLISLAGLWWVSSGRAPAAYRTVLVVVFMLNGIASLVNLYRTFRPHRN